MAGNRNMRGTCGVHAGHRARDHMLAKVNRAIDAVLREHPVPTVTEMLMASLSGINRVDWLIGRLTDLMVGVYDALRRVFHNTPLEDVPAEYRARADRIAARRQCIMSLYQLAVERNMSHDDRVTHWRYLRYTRLRNAAARRAAGMCGYRGVMFTEWRLKVEHAIREQCGEAGKCVHMWPVHLFDDRGPWPGEITKHYRDDCKSSCGRWCGWWIDDDLVVHWLDAWGHTIQDFHIWELIAPKPGSAVEKYLTSRSRRDNNNTGDEDNAQKRAADSRN